MWNFSLSKQQKQQKQQQKHNVPTVTAKAKAISANITGPPRKNINGIPTIPATTKQQYRIAELVTQQSHNPTQQQSGFNKHRWHIILNEYCLFYKRRYRESIFQFLDKICNKISL